MKKILRSVCVMAVVITIGWYAYAHGRQWKTAHTAISLEDVQLTLADTSQVSEEGMDDEQEKIVQELQSLFSHISGAGTVFMEGVMEVKDPSDTAAAAQSFDLSYYLKDSITYYRYGEQEALNTPAGYYVMDHALRRMVVAPAKTLRPTEMMPLQALTRSVKEDGYRAGKQTADGKCTIRLVCENHISCKEVKVEYEAATQKPFLFFYRYTNLDHPTEAAYDKVVAIRIQRWEQAKDQIGTYALPQWVQRMQGGFTTAAGFEDYSIINLFNQ